MREKETKKISKQQTKSKKTRERIFLAAKAILKKQGYERLSVKNVCEEAGVSNGCFYHHFQTKDDLLSCCVAEHLSINPDLLDPPLTADEAKTAITLVYLSYLRGCKELGAEFTANYFTPKNRSLNPAPPSRGPVLSVRNYLQKAVDRGVIFPKSSLEEIDEDFHMLVIGSIFEWCLKDASPDFDKSMRRLIETYLDGLF